MTCHISGRSPTIASGLGPLLTPSRIRMPSPPQKSTTFIASFPRSDRLQGRDRDDQPAAPLAHVAELCADLLPQVPRQDEDVVGPGLREPLGRVDRDVRARKELTLLDRAPVNGVLEQVRPDAAVVQQRVALARGAVP